jgi:hypothetical protein
MSKITLTPGSKKFKLLSWMASRNVTTYGEIQRFLCELNGYDYDQMTTAQVWKKSTVADRRYVCTGTKQVRMYRGIWATNLSSGRDPILRNYCERLYVGGKYLGWVVQHEVKEMIKEKLVVPSSMLEKTFPSDEIPNNSKVVSVKHITIPIGEKPVRKIVVGDFHMGNMPLSMQEALDKLTIRPTTPREALLDAARLAPKISPLVALQEKFEALKKERKGLWDEQDAIERRLTDIESELEFVRGEVNKMFDEE